MTAAAQTLRPIRVPGTYVYCSVPATTDLDAVRPVATILESEGLSVVVREEQAQACGWPILFRAAWIQFGLVSALDAVGLTATVSAALAAAGIGCNMVAGAYHDHVFVPEERAADALAILGALRVSLANKK